MFCHKNIIPRLHCYYSIRGLVLIYILIELIQRELAPACTELHHQKSITENASWLCFFDQSKLIKILNTTGIITGFRRIHQKRIITKDQTKYPTFVRSGDLSFSPKVRLNSLFLRQVIFIEKNNGKATECPYLSSDRT